MKWKKGGKEERKFCQGLDFLMTYPLRWMSLTQDRIFECGTPAYSCRFPFFRLTQPFLVNATWWLARRFSRLFFLVSTTWWLIFQWLALLCDRWYCVVDFVVVSAFFKVDKRVSYLKDLNRRNQMRSDSPRLKTHLDSFHSYLYRRVCPSVPPTIGPYVRPPA